MENVSKPGYKVPVKIFDISIKSKKPEWYTAQCDRRHTSFWRDSCTKENDEHHKQGDFRDFYSDVQNEMLIVIFTSRFIV